MKANEVYKRALNLLGYVDSDDTVVPDSALHKRTIHIINQILADLKQNEIENMNAEINISKICLEALVWGVAMLLSISTADADKNRVFTSIYNSKRSAALCETDTVTDKIPNVGLGEI